jgi:hypothetical protein
MELAEFVTLSIQQVIKGVAGADKTAVENHARINPAIAPVDRNHVKSVSHLAGGDILTMVSFDVAVTTVEESGKKGGIGIFVGSIGIGAQGHREAASQSASRIQFTVPIVLPRSGT